MNNMKKYKRLKKGEIKCDKCEGCGSIIKINTTMIDYKHIDYEMMKECPKCRGEGKLDWVENVVGKGLTKKEKEVEKMRKYFKQHKPKLMIPIRVKKEKKK